jgi:hypothetical protein
VKLQLPKEEPPKTTKPEEEQPKVNAKALEISYYMVIAMKLIEAGKSKSAIDVLQLGVRSALGKRLQNSLKL